MLIYSMYLLHIIFMSGCKMSFVKSYSEILQEIHRRCEANGGCLVWSGATSGSGYGYMRVKVLGGNRGMVESVVMGVHKLALLCTLNRMELPDLCTSSHRCGRKLCCEPSHLSAEPDWVNQRRKLCMERGICSGHENYQHCIL